MEGRPERLAELGQIRSHSEMIELYIVHYCKEYKVRYQKYNQQRFHLRIRRSAPGTRLFAPGNQINNKTGNNHQGHLKNGTVKNRVTTIHPEGNERRE